MAEALTIEQKAELAQSWIVNGTFTYEGVTYTRGINDDTASKVLSNLVTLMITDLAFYFDDFMTHSFASKGVPAKGFTIGKGKSLYWYISPVLSGKYRCLGYEKGRHTLGKPRYVQPEQLVTVHYK